MIRRWRIDAAGGPLELWLTRDNASDTSDDDAERAGDDAIATLAWRLDCLDPLALRVAAEIDEALGGLGSLGGWALPDGELERRARARQLGDMLRREARAGRLAARHQLPPTISPDELPAEPPPDELYLTPPEAPPKDDDEPKAPTWFEVRLVDELGEPIAGVPVALEVSGKHTVVTDGDGRARIDGTYPSTGHLRIDDPSLLRELLRPRWDLVRPGDWLTPEPDRSFVALRGSEAIVQSLFSETLHTVVIQPWVIRARLDGFLFDTNKSFLLPAAVDAPPGLLPPVSELRRWFDQHRATHCLVVGHTDTTGEPWYNDPLSVERAESFIAYLRRDVDHWLGWYGWDRSSDKRWGAPEDRMMLEAIAKRMGQPITLGLVEWYQGRRGLDVDGYIGTNTRRALVEDYMSLQDTSKPLPDLLLAHGCGESFPRTVKPDEAGVAGQLVASDDAAQRRVELLLFDSALGVQPPPPGEVSQAGSREYPEWVKRARRTDELSVEAFHILALRLCDPSHHALPDAFVYLEDPPVEMRAGEGGIVDIPFRKGQLSRGLRWAAKDAPDDIYRTTVYLEYDDDEEGARRKLHNLGYPHSLSLKQAVERFQREFSRPVTGELADICDDLHAWHDHGPPPFVASQPQPGGVSPAQGSGKSKATATPNLLLELVVGILVGTKPPTPSEVTVTLTPAGSATLGGKSEAQTGAPNAAGSARFERLSTGIFTLEVELSREHEGGELVCAEIQSIEVKGRGDHDATNVRLPLVTIRAKNGKPAPEVLEASAKRSLVATVVHEEPVQLAWFGSDGIAILAGTNNPTTIQGTHVSPSPRHAKVVARQTTSPRSLPSTTANTKFLVERMGEHRLPMTVAEVESVRCLLRATKPLTERPWYSRPNKDHAITRKDTEPDFTNEHKLFVVLRGTEKPLELAAKVEPEGTPVVWKVERNPDDHNPGDGLPTLAPAGAKAKLKIDKTGSFFVSARLDLPAGETATPRGLGMVMVEVKSVSTPAVHVYPQRWQAYDYGPSRGVSSGGDPITHDPTRGTAAMEVDAVVHIVGGGPSGQLGTGLHTSGSQQVELGWINNLTSSDCAAAYDNGKSITVSFIRTKGTGPLGAYLPKDSPPAPAKLEMPIIDSSAPGAGGSGGALSTSDASLQPSPTGLGTQAFVEAWDTPCWDIPADYAAMSQDGTQGSLTRMSLRHTFHCFLCAWTDNSIISFPEPEPGRHTFVAIAHFYWNVNGEYDFTQAPYQPVGTPTTNRMPATPLSPHDAADAGCETHEPGTIQHGTAVVDPPW